ncbi:MAG: hypothetical protein GXO27_00215 [Chlorobi bacterium]|nr:hypothetical protein [Chlorobiota bacterium]
MKYRLFFLLVFLLITGTFAQKKEKIKGNRQVVTKLYPVRPFRTLALSEDLHVKLKPAVSGEAVELKADENLHEVLSWNVSGGVLTLSLTKEIVSKRKFEVAVHVPDSLQVIRLDGGARIESDGKLAFPSLTLEAGGNARAELALAVKDTLRLNLKGKSKIELDADTRIALVRMEENSKLKGSLTAKEFMFDGSGSASAALGGTSKTIQAGLREKAEFEGLHFGIKKEAIVKADDKTSVSLKGEGGDIEMHLGGKAALHLRGRFDKYKLKKFEGHASLTREP